MFNNISRNCFFMETNILRKPGRKTMRKQSYRRRRVRKKTHEIGVFRRPILLLRFHTQHLEVDEFHRNLSDLFR